MTMLQLVPRFLEVLAEQANLAFWILGALWLVSMISVPIQGWRAGIRGTRRGLEISVYLQASMVVSVLLPAWGLLRLGITGVGIVLLGWFAEWIGSSRGFLFGRYHYTDVLQPQVLHVPVLIPVAWLMIIPVSWAIGQAIVGTPDTVWARLAIAAIGAGATTAWDLYLDPQMVKWGFWEWDQDGAYLGIPIRKFIGWFMTALLMGLILFPPAIPVAPLLLLFSLIWIMQFVAQLFFWNLRISAFVGFVAMGLFVLPAIVAVLSGR